MTTATRRHRATSVHKGSIQRVVHIHRTSVFLARPARMLRQDQTQPTVLPVPLDKLTLTTTTGLPVKPVALELLRRIQRTNWLYLMRPCVKAVHLEDSTLTQMQAHHVLYVPPVEPTPMRVRLMSVHAHRANQADGLTRQECLCVQSVKQELFADWRISMDVWRATHR